jgi:hypothetical protein
MIWISVLKVFVAAAIISFSSWLSNKKPELAGLILALPLMTLLALPFSYAEYKDAETSIKFAKSIFLGIPVSLLFFIPFLFADKLHLPFWALYAIGIGLLVAGYFLHQFLIRYL